MEVALNKNTCPAPPAIEGRPATRKAGEGKIVPACRDPQEAADRCYALARECDRQGNYRTAFALGERAGEILLQHRLPPGHDLTAPIQRLDTDRIVSHVASSHRLATRLVADGRPAPVFLLGFPCSGEGLLQRLLGSYPGIHVCHDSEALARVREELDALSCAGEVDAGFHLNDAQVRRLQGIYWRHLASGWDGMENPPLIIDSNPFNGLELSLISLLFPGARVVFAWRDPRDACLEAFMEPYGFNEKTALLRHWESLTMFYGRLFEYYHRLEPHLNCRFFHVRYERLIVDPPGEMEELLKFLGISWITVYRTYPDFVDTVGAYLEPRLSGWRNYSAFFAAAEKWLQTPVRVLGYGG